MTDLHTLLKEEQERFVQEFDTLYDWSEPPSDKKVLKSFITQSNIRVLKAVLRTIEEMQPDHNNCDCAGLDDLQAELEETIKQ